MRNGVIIYDSNFQQDTPICLTMFQPSQATELIDTSMFRPQKI
jgi:hypothetical protein